MKGETLYFKIHKCRSLHLSFSQENSVYFIFVKRFCLHMNYESHKFNFSTFCVIRYSRKNILRPKLNQCHLRNSAPCLFVAKKTLSDLCPYHRTIIGLMRCRKKTAEQSTNSLFVPNKHIFVMYLSMVPA